jgi:hypothetical protein
MAFLKEEAGAVKNLAQGQCEEEEESGLNVSSTHGKRKQAKGNRARVGFKANDMVRVPFFPGVSSQNGGCPAGTPSAQRLDQSPHATLALFASHVRISSDERAPHEHR